MNRTNNHLPNKGIPETGAKAAGKTVADQSARHRDSRLSNYFALVFLAPAILSIMAYEFLDYCLYKIRPDYTSYDPITGLGILIPMALMTELFAFILSKVLLHRVKKVNHCLSEYARGNYAERLESEKLAPFAEVAESINSLGADLSSVETLRTEFIGDFSHEFKTPIVSINGFANLLLEENVSPEEQREYLQIIADESARLSNMALQTMLLSKLDTQTKIVAAKTFSLDEQIKQKIILLSREWEAKEIEMKVDLPSLTYESDPDLLSHVWVNLLQNAIKFTPEKGTISVKGALENDGSISIEIKDSGKGMTKEECEKIFNRYYQADPSHATKGLGLGLSIVKRILDLCHGSVQVDSQPGIGTTFTVRLPKTVSGNNKDRG